MLSELSSHKTVSFVLETVLDVIVVVHNLVFKMGGLLLSIVFRVDFWREPGIEGSQK